VYKGTVPSTLKPFLIGVNSGFFGVTIPSV